jgi:DNA primase
MVWTRALELNPTDTPERRAAFEKKLRETLQAIPDESLRRFYREDMDRRLRDMFSPQQAGGERRAPYQYQPRMRGGRFEPPKPGRSIREPIRASESLARTSIFSSRSAIPPREAFILTELMAEPERLAAYSEDLTYVEFHHRDCVTVARFLIDYLAHAEAGDYELGVETLAAELARQGLAEMQGRLLAALPPETRRATEGPKKADRDYALKQALTLHRRFAVLNKELRAAEQALSDHGTEADFALLAELRAQLSALDGTEADAETIEDAATGT